MNRTARVFRIAGAPLRGLLLGLIGIWRLFVSPVLGPSCRYTPTCSAFAATAVRRHGAGRGALLTLGRIARCHPWGGAGHDPVPPARNSRPAENMAESCR